MAQSAAFWDRIAVRYANQPIADEAAYEKKLEITRQYLRPDMEVLEIACGTGSTAILHAPFVKHIQAVDVSAKMLGIAQSKADAAGIANINFVHSSVDEFTAARESFDAIMGFSILHLLEDRKAVINKVYDLLKPGGVFVSSTMCLDGNMRWLKLIAPIGRMLRLIPLVRFFSADVLCAELTDAGFTIDYQWRPNQSKALFIVAKKP